MTLHYHGLPITPEVMAVALGGRCVCISYATKRAKQTAMMVKTAQSIMFDNGAFSIHQAGGSLKLHDFYDWVDPMLAHPHWAVVPDVIGGAVDEQRELLKTWPFPKELGAPVWHLGLPIDYLLELSDTWPRICLGSSEQYWQVGSPKWRARMHEAMETLFKKRRYFPWLHGLRMMAQADKGWPLASVDSVNVSLNYKERFEMPDFMAERIDRTNSLIVEYPQSETENGSV